MSALAPIARSFRSVRGRLPAVAAITLSVAALVMVNQIVGFVAMLLVTPMLIDMTVGRSKSPKAAFTQSRGRIVRYLLWRFGVTVVGVAVTGGALAFTAWTVWSQSQDGGAVGGVGLLVAGLLLMVAAALGFVTGVVGDLLAVAVAAGYSSPWQAVGRVFSPSKRWMNGLSLAVVYVMVFATLAVNAVTFGLFMVKENGGNSLLAAYPQVAEFANSLPSVWVMWAVMAVMGIVTSFVSSVMRPVMLAEVLSSSAGTPRSLPPLAPALVAA